MDQLLTYGPGIAMALAAFCIGLLSPGPNILAVIGASMSKGRPAGKALALGIASGSFVWGSLTAIGLTSVLLVYASVVTAIKIAGALYLLWLAFKAFKSAANSEDPTTHSLDLKGGNTAYFRRGLLIQLTNPKAALTWIAIMSLGMTATTPVWISALIVILAVILSALGHLAYAVLFSTSPVVRLYIKARRYIEAGLGTFFCFASYKLLTSKGSVSS